MLDRTINGISYQQPESLTPLTSKLEKPREKATEIVDNLLEIIAADTTNKNTSTSKKMKELQQSLREIGHIFVEIMELSEQQGLTGLTDPIIANGFVYTLQNWIGTQIIDNPEKSRGLPIAEWKKIFIQTKEKLENLKRVAIQLEEVESQHGYYTKDQYIDLWEGKIGNTIMSAKRKVGIVLPNQGQPTRNPGTRVTKPRTPQTNPPSSPHNNQIPQPGIQFPSNIPPIYLR